MTFLNRKLVATSALAVAASTVLSGCFMSPGQFEAHMDLRKNGGFSFTYEGEIFMLALSDLAEMADQAEMDKPCMDTETLAERPCKEGELEERRAEQERERAMMQGILGGGIDLSDPEAAAQFASKLERQAGWDRVEYVGNGTFDVSFVIRSTLSHDFAFPTFEEFPTGTAFVTATLRDGNRLQLRAPGFATQGGNPLQAMMGGMAGAFGQLASGDSEDSPPMPDLPQMYGSFFITTDAQILTNNTDEGPRAGPTGQILEWQIEPGNTVAPTALLVLEP
jgi:hypothetical protein